MLKPSFNALLALHQSYSISPKKLSTLLVTQSSVDALHTVNDETLFSCGFTHKEIKAFRYIVSRADQSETVKSLLIQIQEQGIGVVTLCCDDYPALLREITDPPPLLYFKGQISLANQPQLAIVGSRRASPGGCQNAYQFAADMAKQDWVITSGMALGIDTSAHHGAMHAGGRTIAVLGCGVDQVYPSANQSLYQEIAMHGLILSELPLGAGPRRENFPKRNRILSGLSLGVLVVEAALKSGSLITARLALEQGREVFALPGSIHNPTSKGCHQLINQGAKLVTCLSDIYEELQGWSAPASQPASPVQPVVTANEQSLLDSIGFEPVELETLLARSSLSAQEVLGLLTDLEIKGLAVLEGGLYHRLKG